MEKFTIEFVDGRLCGFVSSLSGLSKNELSNLARELCEKNEYIDRLYSGEITLADIPEAWQEEIQQCVDKRITAEREAQDEATEADYVEALKALGVDVDG